MCGCRNCLDFSNLVVDVLEGGAAIDELVQNNALIRIDQDISMWLL